MKINRAWTKARLRIAREQGFGLRTFLLVNTPRSFPQSGFHYQWGWTGGIDVVDPVR
jgi:hypothetical protein